jgi:mitochondrial fission protein ELM1
LRTRFSSCWVVTDGKAGMESQCVGLAEALGLHPDIKRVRLRAPWRALSPYLRLGLAHAFQNKTAIAPPWPDLLIASGRLSVPASLYVRAQSARVGKRSFTVQIQDPVISRSHFDLVIAPLHDGLAGSNVISTIGALHRVEPGKLARDAALLAPAVAALPRPYIGVLIGGSNGSYRLGAPEITELASKLRALASHMGAGLLITPSRRTGDENVSLLKALLNGTSAFIWDGEGWNPYFGILGLSDYLVVTADSVNMISEACASGKPVSIYDLPGGSRKSARFRDALFARGLVRPFAIPLDTCPAQPLNEMSEVVKAIANRLAAA